MNEIKNFGLVIAEKHDERDFVLGGGHVPKVVLRPNGDWTDLPDKELQNRKFETYNCTGFNTLAQIEKLVFVLTGEKVNYSDRFLGVMAGTKPPGNDPSKVAQAVRDFGCIPEEMMPFSDDLQNTDEYYSWKGVDKEKCLAEGRKWKEKYNFMHEWVFNENDSPEVKKNKMMEALTLCPPAMAVYAWQKKGDVYVDGGNQPNHWTGNSKGVFGQKWVANDTYVDTDGDTLKDLDWNYKFTYPKRYFLELKNIRERKIGFIKSLLIMLGILKEKVEAELPKPVVPISIFKESSPKYDWDTPVLARHSVRVICDEEKLTVEQKNTLCATMGAESGWKVRAVGKPNSNGTRDWGICQINDGLWIGAGKKFPSTDYVLDNPEACVRWACYWWKKGKRDWWIAYKNKSYLSYM